MPEGVKRPVCPWQAVFYLVFALFGSSIALAAQSVEHSLSFPAAREQLIDVRSQFPVDGAVTELLMPEWTPGSYRIRDFAANVDRISATDGDGRVLQLHKSAKDRWQVNTDGVATLVVKYQVYTPAINVSGSWASRAFTLINGASVFLYTAATRNMAQRVSVPVPSGRGSIYSALPLADDDKSFTAKGYDELVDNPIVITTSPVRYFSVRGQPYAFLNVGENGLWDGEQASRDVEKIVTQTQKFWQLNPLQRPYWFLNFAVDGRGGLEHDHSTVIMTGRRQMRVRDHYIQWLGVISHEFFHAWNVRRMRPAALAQTDFQHEQYSTQLWLAEGLTSYYDNLLLSRARLITPAEYMELLARDIYRLETTPGRKLRPLTEASLDTWIRHYRPNANSVNSTISYYTKGAVIGFVLDTYLRKTTRGRKSLDDVMRQMYRLYADKPYPEDAFISVVTNLGGSKAADYLKPLLLTATDPDVDAALAWYGLQLDRHGPKNRDQAEDQPPQSGIGVVWDKARPGLIVKSVLAGSAGSSAGILPGDELLAIGDERVTTRTLTAMLGVFRPGEKTTLLLARRGHITRLGIELETALPEQFDIVAEAVFGKRQAKRLQSLLGQELRNGS